MVKEVDSRRAPREGGGLGGRRGRRWGKVVVAFLVVQIREDFGVGRGLGVGPGTGCGRSSKPSGPNQKPYTFGTERYKTAAAVVMPSLAPTFAGSHLS